LFVSNLGEMFVVVGDAYTKKMNLSVDLSSSNKLGKLRKAEKVWCLLIRARDSSHLVRARVVVLCLGTTWTTAAAQRTARSHKQELSPQPPAVTPQHLALLSFFSPSNSNIPSTIFPYTYIAFSEL
jgi:hypothetical protein